MNARRFLPCGRIWSLSSKTGDSFDLSNYQKMSGLEVVDSEHYNTINCFCFYILDLNFQNKFPSFQAYKNLIRIKINSEYKIADILLMYVLFEICV